MSDEVAGAGLLRLEQIQLLDLGGAIGEANRAAQPLAGASAVHIGAGVDDERVVCVGGVDKHPHPMRLVVYRRTPDMGRVDLVQVLVTDDIPRSRRRRIRPLFALGDEL
jgi:hypothetical protein